jgi:hypothetical protein
MDKLDKRGNRMKGIDRFGLLEFKQRAKSFYLSEDVRDDADIAEMKDAINNIVTWLRELEENKEK